MNKYIITSDDYENEIPEEFVLNPEKGKDLTERTNKLIATGKKLPEEYSVRIEVYGDEDNRYCPWGKVFIRKNGNDILSFVRNYRNAGPFLYVKQGDEEFIIASADYQCLTVFNLTTNVRTDYCYGYYDYGAGFCPIGLDYDEEENSLEIYGCFWGCPYEYITIHNVDFNNIDFDECSRRYEDEE